MTQTANLASALLSGRARAARTESSTARASLTPTM
jgi:hypothetical protein